MTGHVIRTKEAVTVSRQKGQLVCHGKMDSHCVRAMGTVTVSGQKRLV